MYLKISFWRDLRGFAVVLYQVWAFIVPGLDRNERRYVLVYVQHRGTVFSRRLFRLSHGLSRRPGFSYHIQRPVYAHDNGGEYRDLFLTIIAGLGIVFEMPILVFFLALMGVLNAPWMLVKLPLFDPAIFIVAAIIIFTTDIMKI